MSAVPASKALKPEDLLAIVRKTSDRFQRRDQGLPRDPTDSAFTSRGYVKAVEEPEPDINEDLGSFVEPKEENITQPQALSAEFTPTPEPPTIDLDAERKTAWQAGFDAAMAEHSAKLEQELEIARAQAQTEATTELEEAKTAFAETLQRLVTAEDEMMTNLQTQIEKAVRSLAAERAGQKIDELPKPFQRRIEKTIREIGEGMDGIIVQMHPADLIAIRPHIKSYSPLTNSRLSPDPKLGRGDIRLKMDTITFSDCISERSSGGLT